MVISLRVFLFFGMSSASELPPQAKHAGGASLAERPARWKALLRCNQGVVERTERISCCLFASSGHLNGNKEEMKWQRSARHGQQPNPERGSPLMESRIALSHSWPRRTTRRQVERLANQSKPINQESKMKLNQEQCSQPRCALQWAGNSPKPSAWPLIEREDWL